MLPTLAEIIAALERNRAQAEDTAEIDLHLTLLRLQTEPQGLADPAWLAGQVLSTLQTLRPDLEPGLAAVAPLLANRPLFSVYITQYLNEGRVHLPADSAEWETLLAFILNVALRPTLRARAATFVPAAEPQSEARCPVCNGWPDLAALRKEPNEGERALLCVRCDCEWVYVRVGCPFCDNREPARQGYHRVGDDDHYRLYVCEACGAYLKTVDQRAATEILPLPAERVLTIGLDLTALDAGYRPGVAVAHA